MFGRFDPKATIRRRECREKETLFKSLVMLTIQNGYLFNWVKNWWNSVALAFNELNSIHFIFHIIYISLWSGTENGATSFSVRDEIFVRTQIDAHFMVNRMLWFSFHFFVGIVVEIWNRSIFGERKFTDKNQPWFVGVVNVISMVRQMKCNSKPMTFEDWKW